MSTASHTQTANPFTVTPLFPLGQAVITPGANDALEAHRFDPIRLLTRHVTGDWGDLCPEDALTNQEAVAYGNRVMSSYQLNADLKVWVITEHDRSCTTILLPDEY